jgi:plasmid stability protein
MQYTIRNVPRAVDRALRRRAKVEGRSLNELAIDALTRATGLSGEVAKQRSLSDLAGSWADDPEIEGALADQDRVDEEMWK